MKIRVLTQAEKPHDTNRLHDAFITASIPPLQVESTETESRFSFDEAVSDASITAVITAYALTAPAAAVDVKVAWTNYKNAVNNATTVPQIKSALTLELGVLLKELLRSRAGDLQ
jgi:hypothetical protein